VEHESKKVGGGEFREDSVKLLIRGGQFTAHFFYNHRETASGFISSSLILPHTTLSLHLSAFFSLFMCLILNKKTACDIF
jgi:hypothetical protein